MIRSMTGYGDAQCEEGGLSYALGIKSVNHRYLKLTIKLPEAFQFAEAAVEKLLRQSVRRGSVTCILRVRSEDATGPAALNLPALQRYVDQMAQIRVPDGAHTTIDLAAMAALPGVCAMPDSDEAAQRRQLELIRGLVSQALDALVQMRTEEGEAIRVDLSGMCDALRAHRAEVAVRAPMVVDEYHHRLRARVEMLCNTGKLELETEALMREVAIYADRCDISEELVRLSSHLDQFASICGRDEEVGRTLDFLTQELLREANTVAAKSSDAIISRNVVDIKRLIDRLREQVQNVE